MHAPPDSTRTKVASSMRYYLRHDTDAFVVDLQRVENVSARLVLWNGVAPNRWICMSINMIDIIRHEEFSNRLSALEADIHRLFSYLEG